MITERTLRKWRMEALAKEKSTQPHLASPNESEINILSKRILRLTQELMDQHLLRK